VGSIFSGIREMRDGLALLAAIGNLSLAVITIFARGTLARRLAALCFVLFGWNFCTLAAHLSFRRGIDGQPLAVLDAAFTALSPALVMEVVLAFVGQTRRRASVRWATWAIFGALSVVSLGALVSRSFQRWIDGDGWAWLLFAAFAPTFVLEIVLLGAYLKATPDPREKARARIVLAALAIGSASGMSDLVHSAGVGVPYLGALGTFVASLLLSTLVLRFGLLDRVIPLRTAIYVAAMMAAFLLAYMVVLDAFKGGAQLFAVLALTGIAAFVGRELASSVAESRARTRELAMLGRFSAQMAHDIKGPLSAIVGAVDVLRGTTEQSELIDLIGDQGRRIGDVIDRYDRMARIEPVRTIVRIDEMVSRVTRAHRVATVVVERLEIEADPALLEAALENVIRNASEATGDPARVRVEIHPEPANAIVRVIDAGPGMDARVLERATDDFFTTKTNGSGLGLSFVRRVVEAHGGTLVLSSRPGEGTTVEIRLPC
jgi:two-component system, NtrC family, sensor histidine kinase HydH